MRVKQGTWEWASDGPEGIRVNEVVEMERLIVGSTCTRVHNLYVNGSVSQEQSGACVRYMYTVYTALSGTPLP